MNKTYYGKYRGKVSVNEDKEKRGRLRVKIKGFYGEAESPWALPCVPYAGEGVGLFLIPPINANVWIEFENGDPDRPIWTGCFWSDPLKDSVDKKIEAPEQKPDIKLLKTKFGTIEINDADNKKSIKISQETMMIEMNALGIEITNGKASIKLNNQKISMNKDALEVT